jgi:hypothetical protein
VQSARLQEGRKETNKMKQINLDGGKQINKKRKRKQTRTHKETSKHTRKEAIKE